MRRLSFSQCWTWEKCPFQWYKKKILKIPDNQDLSYAHRGNAVHKPLEYYYKKESESLDDLRNKFDLLWKKYRLDYSIIKNQKENSWDMIARGLSLGVPCSTPELKIFFSDFLCYIDIFDSTTRIIGDWKTSTRTKEKDAEYKLQLQVYCWMVYRKFGWVPEKATVYYLKYEGKKSILEFTPTMEDVKVGEAWVRKIQKEIDEALITRKFKKHDDVSNCDYFCGFKNECFGKNKIHFDLYINDKNKIFIRGYNSPILTKGLTKVFSYQKENSEHIENACGWDGVVNLFDSRNYSVPIGFKDLLIYKLKQYTETMGSIFTYDIIDKRREPIKLNIMPEKLQHKTLRDYQKEACKVMVEKKVGLLHAGTGSGKTLMGTEIIRKHDVKTLWLTHKIDLAQQSKKVLENELGIKIGLIQGDNLDIEYVTIATVQTLCSKLDFFKEYLKSIDFIIVDECHRALSNQFQNLLKIVPAKYRVGLSGSIIIQNPEIKLLYSQLGTIQYEKLTDELQQEGYLAKPEINIKIIKNRMVRGDWKEVEEEFIINNEERNEEIKNICEKEHGKFNVLLVSKIKHGEMLKEMIPDSQFINGELSSMDRKTLMDAARAGYIKNLIATYQLLGEGIDMPKIENIIICQGGGRSMIPIIQNAGRVLRKAKGKDKKIYDFYDKGKYLADHSSIRQSIYEKIGDVNLS